MKDALKKVTDAHERAREPLTDAEDLELLEELAAHFEDLYQVRKAELEKREEADA